LQHPLSPTQKKSVETPKQNQISSLKPLHVCSKNKKNQNQIFLPKIMSKTSLCLHQKKKKSSFFVLLEKKKKKVVFAKLLAPS